MAEHRAENETHSRVRARFAFTPRLMAIQGRKNSMHSHVGKQRGGRGLRNDGNDWSLASEERGVALG